MRNFLLLCTALLLLGAGLFGGKLAAQEATSGPHFRMVAFTPIPMLRGRLPSLRYQNRVGLGLLQVEARPDISQTFVPEFGSGFQRTTTNYMGLDLNLGLLKVHEFDRIYLCYGPVVTLGGGRTNRRIRYGDPPGSLVVGDTFLTKQNNLFLNGRVGASLRMGANYQLSEVFSLGGDFNVIGASIFFQRRGTEEIYSVGPEEERYVNWGTYLNERRVDLDFLHQFRFWIGINF